MDNSGNTSSAVLPDTATSSDHPSSTGARNKADDFVPRAADVLCGRGGISLRHSGNLIYRKMVTMNKERYLTCLKTEKLKISKSIVASVRQRNGRFMEKDKKSGEWVELSDKKAVEKTSQALREGQPKLREKMVQVRGFDSATSGSLVQAASTGAMLTAPPPSLQTAVHNGFNGMNDTVVSRDIFDHVPYPSQR